MRSPSRLVSYWWVKERQNKKLISRAPRPLVGCTEGHCLRLLWGTPIECAVRASPKCSDPEPHTDRHSLMYHRLWTLAITSSLYGLKIIPKSVISLIDTLFVFLRYTFFLIYIPAQITWTLHWRFLAFISEYFFENICNGPTFTCIHRPYFTVIKARQQTCGKVPL